MPTPITARGITTLAAAGTLLLCVLAFAPTADAATINGCYKRSTGALRVRHAGQRCRRGEVRVSWNTAGPAGKNGANGKNGTNGKTGAPGKNGTNGTSGSNGSNGAVAGYSTTQAKQLDITTEPGNILSKELPPGHYLVSAKVEITATATAAGGVQAECELTLTTGTGEKLLDSAGWAAPLVSFVGPSYLAASTLPLEGALELTTPGTVAVECETLQAGAAGEEVTASDGQLIAVQTTGNS